MQQIVIKHKLDPGTQLDVLVPFEAFLVSFGDVTPDPVDEIIKKLLYGGKIKYTLGHAIVDRQTQTDQLSKVDWDIYQTILSQTKSDHADDLAVSRLVLISLVALTKGERFATSPLERD